MLPISSSCLHPLVFTRCSMYLVSRSSGALASLSLPYHLYGTRSSACCLGLSWTTSPPWTQWDFSPLGGLISCSVFMEMHLVLCLNTSPSCSRTNETLLEEVMLWVPCNNTIPMSLPPARIIKIWWSTIDNTRKVQERCFKLDRASFYFLLSVRDFLNK